jgi:hypothetical protein
MRRRRRRRKRRRRRRRRLKINLFEKQVTNAVARFNGRGTSVCSDNIRRCVVCQALLLLLALIHCKVI